MALTAVVAAVAWGCLAVPVSDRMPPIITGPPGATITLENHIVRRPTTIEYVIRFVVLAPAAITITLIVAHGVSGLRRS